MTSGDRTRVNNANIAELRVADRLQQVSSRKSVTIKYEAVDRTDAELIVTSE